MNTNTSTLGRSAELGHVKLASGNLNAPPRKMNSRKRFLDAAACRPVDRPPIWMMRQAGRCLPEYRALKEKYTFLELVRTPELAAEVTLQPIRRFGFDAAILFSDILVVPEALGQGYHFRDTGGIEMEYTLRTAAEIKALSVHAIEDRLSYVSEALAIIKPQLGGRTALLGFAGSPWTLANFMLEGNSTKTPIQSLHLLRSDPALLFMLLEKLALAVTEFLRQQIRAGVDAVQIFDSHGGLIPRELFAAASGQWMQRVVAGLGGKVPVMVFSKGTRDWATLHGLGADVISIDTGYDLREARARFPRSVAIQGNLDPELLIHCTPSELSTATNELLDKMRDRPGYIFNLGHGVPPATPLENIASVVSTVRNFHV